MYGTSHYYYFDLPISHFHCAKFKKKILTANPELCGCVIFGPQIVHLPQTKFKKKLLISFSSTYWPLSFCKIFKKFLKPIQIYEDVPFLGPKYPNLS